MGILCLFVFFHRSLSASCFLPPLSLYSWIISSLHFWHRVVSITGGGSRWAQLADLWLSASCPLKHWDLRVTETKMGCDSADWQMTESYASSSNTSVYLYSSRNSLYDWNQITTVDLIIMTPLSHHYDSMKCISWTFSHSVLLHGVKAWS